jgi:hypothetical protein
MIRQTHSDRLRWWATLLEGRTIADRQHGWSGLWLSSEDAAALVRTLREAAEQTEVRLASPRADDRSDDWPDTQPGELIEDRPAAGGPAVSATRPVHRDLVHPSAHPNAHAGAGLALLPTQSPAALHPALRQPAPLAAGGARRRPAGGLRLLNPLRMMLR